MTDLAENVTKVVLGVLKRGGDNYNIYVAVKAALAATPAVGGEREALDKILRRLSGPASSLIWDIGQIVDVALAAPPASPLRGREINFGYTNWHGLTSYRRVRPISIRYGTSEYHKQAGWLMLAHDLDKNEQREFAMRDMVLVEPSNEIALSASPPEQPAPFQPHENCNCLMCTAEKSR